MKTSHMSDTTGLSNRIVADTTTTAPRIRDATPRPPSPERRSRRNVIILLSLLGVLTIAVPLCVWAIVSGRNNSPVAAPSATNGTTQAQVPQASVPGSPPTLDALPPRYDAVRLPGLSGSTQHPTLGFAINESGQAVGQSDTANGQAHPVLWRNGKVIDLGVLDSGTNDEFGVARDINNHGDVVGASNTAEGQRAVLWRNGQMINLGALNGNPTFAYAVNDNGQIVGTSTTQTGELRGFLWDNGRMRDLGIDGGVIPRDINNRGLVVGSLDFGEGGARQHAFLWENGVVKRLAAPGISSSAEAINNQGEIVGRYILDSERGSQPVRWYQGSMTELGLLANGTDGNAVAINGQGHILGTSNTAPHSMVEHAFLWWRGALHDLTPAGVPAESAYDLADINNHGQIVAGAILFTPRG